MANDASRHELPTRRDYAKYVGAVVDGSLLMGRTNDSHPTLTPTEFDRQRAADIVKEEV